MRRGKTLLGIGAGLLVLAGCNMKDAVLGMREGGSEGGGPDGSLGCVVGDVTYPQGSSWSCGCNTCWCNDPPAITSTTVACEDPPDAGEGGAPGVDEAGPPGLACDGGNPNDVCGASCCTAPGTAQPLHAPDDLYSVISGSWQLCGNPADIGAPADTIGFEFAPHASNPPGAVSQAQLYYLVSGPNGPVRGDGADYQLTYDVAPEGNTVQFDAHPTPNSGWGGPVSFSPCPTELQIENIGNFKSIVLVRFDSSVPTPQFCQTAADCTGPIPTVALTCPDGGSAGFGWACANSACELKSGCSDDVTDAATGCVSGGMTFPAGASWQCGCNTCYCNNPPTVTSTAVLCTYDAGVLHPVTCGGTGGAGGACQASCCTPPGPTADLYYAQDVAQVIDGSWQLCGDPGSLGVPPDTVGVEFGANKDAGTDSATAYYLVNPGTGVVRGNGPAYQVTYKIGNGALGGPLDVTIGAAGGTWGGDVGYSPCPDEIALHNRGTGVNVTLVRFDDQSNGPSACQTAADCTGVLPGELLTCGDGGGAHLHWTCDNAACMVHGCD